MIYDIIYLLVVVILITIGVIFMISMPTKMLYNNSIMHGHDSKQSHSDSILIICCSKYCNCSSKLKCYLSTTKGYALSR